VLDPFAPTSSDRMYGTIFMKNQEQLADLRSKTSEL